METKDQNGEFLKIGNWVLMPEPESTDDWQYGDFIARITNIEENNMLTVVDMEDDVFNIESNRVTKDYSP